jgi:hypothetical protein
MSASLNSMLLSRTAVADRAAARPADVSRREAVLEEERRATGGDEQLNFHQAPPRSRVQRSVWNPVVTVNRAEVCNRLLLGYRAREGSGEKA